MKPRFRVLQPLLLLALLSGLGWGCARAPLRSTESAMRRASVPALQDDLPREPLLEAIEREIAFFETLPQTRTFSFGDRVLSQTEYVAALNRFLEIGRAEMDPARFREAVANGFDFYEVYGDKDWGDVFITSYYEPLLQGSPVRTDRFTQPLYAAPEDILEVDLSLFDPKFSGERKYRARLEGKKLVPYFSREDIDSKQALAKRKLEVCWVDPVDAFFLQIQGSGTVELPDGTRMRLNYAEKNGHPYEPIGKFLRTEIPAERLNMHTIEAHLRKLPPDRLQQLLNRNPSYVFFKPLDQSALTFLGVPATDGRTIATDRRYFPKGALAFLQFEKPRFDAADSEVPVAWEPTGRFVLDQDIGGAITGGGRVDLFWGRGDEAKRYAGAMKARGRLYYLVPK